MERGGYGGPVIWANKGIGASRNFPANLARNPFRWFGKPLNRNDLYESRANLCELVPSEKSVALGPSVRSFDGGGHHWMVPSVTPEM